MFYICPEDKYIRENFARAACPSCVAVNRLILDIFKRENAQKAVGKTFCTRHGVQSRKCDVSLNSLALIYAELENGSSLFTRSHQSTTNVVSG